MKKRKLICVGMAFGLVICMMLTGCGASAGDAAVPETKEGAADTKTAEKDDVAAKETQTENKTVQEMMSKYAAGAGEYDGKTITIKELG